MASGTDITLKNTKRNRMKIKHSYDRNEDLYFNQIAHKLKHINMDRLFGFSPPCMSITHTEPVTYVTNQRTMVPSQKITFQIKFHNSKLTPVSELRIFNTCAPFRFIRQIFKILRG